MEFTRYHHDIKKSFSERDLLAIQKLLEEEADILLEIDALLNKLPEGARNRYHDLIVSVNKERETIMALDAYGSLKSVDDNNKISSARTRLSAAMNELTRLTGNYSGIFAKREPLLDKLLNVRDKLRELGYYQGHSV